MDFCDDDDDDDDDDDEHLSSMRMQCPDQFWGPPSLPTSGYWGSFLGDNVVRE
jgi:hypothetical protein